jgi:hypothetical protein
MEAYLNIKPQDQKWMVMQTGNEHEKLRPGFGLPGVSQNLPSYNIIRMKIL